MRLATRKARESDRSFIWSLTCAAYKEMVVAQFGEWNEEYQTHHFEEKWRENQFQVIRENDQDVGAVWKEDQPDYIFIRELLLLPQFQNRGIGTLILQQVIADGNKQQKPVRLKVVKANRAIELYKRLGFRNDGEAQGGYSWWMQFDI